LCPTHLSRVVCAIAAAVAFAGGSLTGAPAQADGTGLAITVTSASPTIWQDGDILRITGTVANQSSSAMTGLRIVLWQSDTAITSLTSLGQALTSTDAANQQGTQVKDGSRVSQPLGSAGGGALGAGAVAGFTLSGTPSLPKAGAAYLAGVQVLDDKGQVLAQARIAIGYPLGSTPPDSALVVPLTARPSLLTPAATGDTPSPAVFQDESLFNDLSGQLGQMITLAERPGVTPLIDPALVAELTQMAAGYQVQLDDGTLADGHGQQAAQSALDRLGALVARGDAYRLPFGAPDFNAMATVPNATSILALSALDEADLLASLPVAVLMRGQAPTPGARQLVTGAMPDLIISDGLDTSATLQTAGSDANWVAVTPIKQLSGLKGPSPSFTGADAIQSPAARLAWLTVAAAQGSPVVVVADDSQSLQLVNQWLGDGWQPSPLAHMVATLTPADLALASEPPAVTLPDALSSKLTLTQYQVSVMSDLGNDPETATSEGRRLLLCALSTAWQGDWTTAAAWLDQASAKLDQQVGTGRVELHVAHDWILSSTDNRMPISVINGLGIPVTVQVRFASENPSRLSVPDTDPVTIDPGATASVIAMPQAGGNGSVQVKAQLYTLQGSPVGQPTAVQVVTTSAGRLGWMIIVGSGAAFVLATSLRVRQVRRSRQANAAVSPTPTAADTAE